MRISIIQQGAASALLLSLLTACGGGGDDSTQPTTSPAGGVTDTTAPTATAPATPVASTPTPEATTPTANTVPASNTLVLAAGGTSSVAAGSYTLDTTYPDAAYALDAGGLIAINPENGAFDLHVIYSPAAPSKYVISFVDSSGELELNFACRGAGWTTEELAIETSNSTATDGSNTAKTLGEIEACSKDITLDDVARRITFLKLALPDTSDKTRSVMVSANFTWTAPTTAALP